MTDERHVLVIFPHPDDETFSSAGTLASYIKKRHTCNICMFNPRTNGQKFR